MKPIFFTIFIQKNYNISYLIDLGVFYEKTFTIIHNRH